MPSRASAISDARTRQQRDLFTWRGGGLDVRASAPCSLLGWSLEAWPHITFTYTEKLPARCGHALLAPAAAAAVATRGAYSLPSVKCMCCVFFNTLIARSEVRGYFFWKSGAPRPGGPGGAARGAFAPFPYRIPIPRPSVRSGSSVVRPVEGMTLTEIDPVHAIGRAGAAHVIALRGNGVAQWRGSGGA